jgi:hypothetical protein
VHSSLKVFTSVGKVGAQNSATLEAVGYFLDAYKKTLYPGPLQIQDLCQKYGLDHIAMEIFASDHFSDLEKVRSQGKAFLSGALKAMSPFLVEDEGRGLSAEYIEEVIKRSMVELDGELYLHSEMQFIVGRKPTVQN